MTRTSSLIGTGSAPSRRRLAFRQSGELDRREAGQRETTFGIELVGVARADEITKLLELLLHLGVELLGLLPLRGTESTA